MAEPWPMLRDLPIKYLVIGPSIDVMSSIKEKTKRLDGNKEIIFLIRTNISFRKLFNMTSGKFNSNSSSPIEFAQISSSLCDALPWFPTLTSQMVTVSAEWGAASLSELKDTSRMFPSG